MLDVESVNKELCIPVCVEDLELVKAVREWPNTLGSLGLDISTGPVVPFRAKRFLADCCVGIARRAIVVDAPCPAL